MPSLPDSIWGWKCTPGAEKVLHKERIPLPKIDSNGLLVKIKAMGVCHSDCVIRDLPEAPPQCLEGSTLGNEGAGEMIEMIEVGSGVDTSTFQVGDMVAIHLIPGCGKCLSCQSGNPRICQVSERGAYGLGYDGFMQEALAVRADACAKVPKAEVKPYQTIVIAGLGGLGLNGLQTAPHLGVEKIVAFDKRQDALDIAIQMGLKPGDAYCTTETLSKPLLEILSEKGIVIDTVIDFVRHERPCTSRNKSFAQSASPSWSPPASSSLLPARWKVQDQDGLSGNLA
ncbi:hypothetical protein CERZMDRAFT_103087 [Cercospora zeae-maydis SCOH1-5]|uniref:Alcohol dehydrogenase-like N-terminal domain-containing protein n=1 Tax=Cercospora zeae-maydis SCOH1-5 TaxID=717836 RepID=A0A6A6F399_9PEZI|nr:hypothetical protein CERZMDRAFT_103087 [Cercospora zeae-maydis SCOH1-5]